MQINPINSNYNIKNNQYKNQKNMTSFKGGMPEPVINGLSSFYQKVAKTEGFQNFTKWFSHSDRSFTHLLVAESVILSSFYMINTLTNDKIKKEQKPQMLINDTMTLGVSAAGSYLLDDKITKVIDKVSDSYMKNHSDFYSNPANVEAFKGGMRKVKTLVIFGLIYRYLGPVLITPLANKISSKFFYNKKSKDTEQTQEKK